MTRPRVADTEAVLIHVSPISHGSANPALMTKRMISHASGVWNQYIAMKPAALKRQPPMIAGTAPVVARIAGGDPSPAAGALSPATVIVQPGDTLWSIAAAVAPGVDVRVTVDRLAELNGSAPIVVGQQLELPAP